MPAYAARYRDGSTDARDSCSRPRMALASTGPKYSASVRCDCRDDADRRAGDAGGRVIPQSGTHKQSGKSFLFCTSMGKVGGRKNKVAGVQSVIHGVASHRVQSCARSHRRRSCRDNGVSDLIALRRHPFSSRDSVVNDRVARRLLTITTNVLNRLREALTARTARDMTALDARRRLVRGEHTIART